MTFLIFAFLMQNRNALIKLNLGLVFLSTSGVLGRYITVDSLLATWLRAILALVLLLMYCRVRHISLRIDIGKDLLSIVLSGLLLGAHWVTYFFALDYSNVAIALLSLYTYAGLTTILEPLILKTKFNMSDLLLSMIVILGVAVMAPSWDLESNYTIAIIFGLVSALLYALRNIVISDVAKRYNGSSLMVYQLIVISVAMLFFSGYYNYDYVIDQMPWIVLLALCTTAIGHTVFVESLSKLNATTAGLLSCIVPVYGIFWGFIFLGEVPALRTIMGGGIILLAVVLKTIRLSK